MALLASLAAILRTDKSIAGAVLFNTGHRSLETSRTLDLLAIKFALVKE
jgi:hypothetical protein